MHARVLSPDAGQGHGAGAEHIMRAEACFLRGDDAGAETLCHRAFFAADTRRQNSIYLCGLFLLARIAILRGMKACCKTQRRASQSGPGKTPRIFAAARRTYA
ncbi:MAG: hypothetical protein MRZ67_01975 [Christensenella sp.]|nr:hypothetical protein [Christensenella sp.]